ncbi:glycoside hydrolase family 65 protein [Blastococcus sp. Marseille-P5729]|uniref:glycoside hydrolase family 65 protein n=1 Tax=Blastococcus sp. Marseille-P5729 TaxID=2086582 RepID=UPI000D10B3CC|nr:glycosyl hydrolase family 65 protein [Blastococcus sp. Marseille-P5729]
MNLDEPMTDPLDRSRFPVDPWALREVSYSKSDLGTTETLFTVGNGYLGMRGNPEEGRDAHTHGTFVNGFHETWAIRHAEEAYGFARTGQTIVNAPDAKVMKLYVDDEPLLLATADLEEYERVLDFKEGVLRREVVWRTPSGKRVRISSKRMVSFTQRHLAIMQIQVTMLEGDAPVVISSQILNRQDGRDEYNIPEHAMGKHFDPRKASNFEGRVLEPKLNWYSDRRMILGYRATNSGMTLAVGADHAISTDNEYEQLNSSDDDYAKKVYRVHAHEGRPITITKVASYHSSRGVPVRELVDRVRRTLDRVRDHGVEHYEQEQRDWLADFWAASDVEIEGQPATQQAVRWNLFQLAQASARSDQLGVAAKGVSGTGYEGHYFWDSEVYVMPFLTYTSPYLARNLLRFRWNMLPAARERADELSQRGALFPWRTINGEEASAYYAAGTAQYHIDADIAYALVKYGWATGDADFLVRQGVDILVETARMFADLGFWRNNGERSFHIHGVTGPDEYTAVVNNNLFTNVMARFNLEQAALQVESIKATDPASYVKLVKRLRLGEDEPAEWHDAARRMTIPYDEALEIHPQDEHFLDREMWDLSATPEENKPLLLHFHPLVIYRFQVLKQADVVLAMFLQGDQFTLEQKRANFEYYDPITTGDSTLSAVVQSIIAAEVGYHDMALDYFMKGLYVDLADLHGNTSDGVHVASTGGVWSALAYGFGGMRDYDGHVTFDPRLPTGWESLRFRITLKGARLEVTLRQGSIEFRVDGGDVEVGVRGQRHYIRPHEPVRVQLDGQGDRIDGILGTSPLIGGRRSDGTVITAGVPEPPSEPVPVTPS